jgi:uncharacterized peroxidase-related enzyme
MARLTPVDPAEATGRAKDLLAGVNTKLGFTPNMLSSMSGSPAVLEGYLAFSAALAGGALPARLREKIAIAVAEANGCGYCLAAHSTLGKMAGLTNADVLAGRRGTATDSKSAAAVGFARAVVGARGHVTDADVKRVREAGYSDAEVAEIVANVALNVFTNYFNLVAETETDF